jgi:hypothetical protein
MTGSVTTTVRRPISSGIVASDADEPEPKIIFVGK